MYSQGVRYIFPGRRGAFREASQKTVDTREQDDISPPDWFTAPEWVERLLNWYTKAKRPLPWRRQPEPYRIWVSEVMLQQTRVETALPHYQRFLEAFPRLEDLAAAPEEEVLRLWSGLGYYQRARRLHQAARLVYERYKSEPPREYEIFSRLPGVGPYTAGAVLSIAYGLPVPAVDGNVRRVYSRLLGLAESLPPGHWTRLARLPFSGGPAAGRPGDFNQALMELGALVCRPAAPRCGECPLQSLCATGIGSWVPSTTSARSKRSEPVHWVVFLVRRDGKYLMHRRPPEALLGGLWDFPIREGCDRPESPVRLSDSPADLILRPTGRLGTVRHAITFRRLHLHVLPSELSSPAPAPWTWVHPLDEDLPRSSYVDKVVRLAEKG